MEDTGRKRFQKGMEQADRIILLEPNAWVGRHRIFLRWIKQNLGLEKCGYKPGLWMLKAMLRWAHDYETGADGLRSRLEPYREKMTILKNNREIREYINSIVIDK